MMQVFNTNLLEEAVTKTASSAASGYPASNVYNIERRRLTWRSAGYWKVESGSNTIVFRETNGGADLTATIAAGEYATDALFLAAIKTALDAAGDSTYTITRNGSTGKIVLTSNGSGGGGVFQLRWTTAADFGTIIGFDTSANDTGALAYTADLLRIHTEEFFIFDFGAAVNPTGFIAVSDRNVALNVSPTATVKLYGNATNAWGSPSLTLTLTWRDFLLAYVDPDGFGSYRYWKFQIIDNDNPDLYLELGAMFLGTHVDLERGGPAFPYVTRHVDNSLIDQSEAGQTWVGKKPKTALHTLTWEKLTTADLELLESVWEQYGKHSSFFVAMDPESIFSTDGVKRTKLVKFENEPESRLVSAGNWSMPWVLREEL